MEFLFPTELQIDLIILEYLDPVDKAQKYLSDHLFLLLQGLFSSPHAFLHKWHGSVYDPPPGSGLSIKIRKRDERRFRHP